jgi:hypothetical protein
MSERNSVPNPNDMLILVFKGVCQGAISSPCPFNNSVINVEDASPTSCIHNFLDVSIISYADDIFNISHTPLKISQVFKVLQSVYLKLGLSFNPKPSEVVYFNRMNKPTNSSLDISSTKSVVHTYYLGLPIGSTIKHTRNLLVDYLQRKISAAYGHVISC